jgi:serine/threonine-protein kinase
MPADRDAQEALGRLDELFEAAIARAPEERDAFLRQVAATDPSCAAELASLLAHHRDDDFLLTPVAAQEAVRGLLDLPSIEALEPGTRVGAFTILRRIGVGGASTVYEAEQDAPRRSVALKIVRPEVAGERTVLRRFRDEAATLARLRHPDIAQVYAFGIERLGEAPTPYLAVEFVPQATDILRWFESRRLGLRERVRLIARVCDAIAHGHARGILHRDLKPGNILVDGEGRPRVIDFGIAKVLEPPSTALMDGPMDGPAATLDRHTSPRDGPADAATASGVWIGTPAYMSPEQFEGDPRDIDVRSDVYSMGVVLYEAILGRLPIEVDGRRPIEAARLVVERAPLAPRSVDPRVDVDLETILLTALAKPREDRYESIAALREDLLAWADHAPIAARRPSLLRRIRLASKRNPPAAAAIALAIGVAVAALALTLRSANTAREERDASEASLRHLARMLDAPVTERDGERTRLADVLDHVARDLDADEATPPLVRARLHRMLGHGFDSIGTIPEAGRQFDRAVEVLRREAPNSPMLAAALTDLMGPMFDESRFDEARRFGEEALAIQRRTVGFSHIDTANTLNELGILELVARRPADALAPLAEAFRVRRELLGTDAAETGTTLANLGVTLQLLGDLPLGERMILTAHEWAESTNAAPQFRANRMRAAAAARDRVGDHAGAIDFTERAERVLLEAYGPVHPSVMRLFREKANRLCLLDRAVEATAAADESLRLARELFDNEESPAVREAVAFRDLMRERAAHEE